LEEDQNSSKTLPRLGQTLQVLAPQQSSELLSAFSGQFLRLYFVSAVLSNLFQDTAAPNATMYEPNVVDMK
jgi:hypothetical protein